MTEPSSSPRMQSTLGRVRGLGSAKEGVHHWWMQRLTALALVPLGIWFVCQVVLLANKPIYAARIWLAEPVNGLLMLLFSVVVLWHSRLGLQVIVEDYIHHKAFKVATLVFLNYAALAMIAAVSLAVLTVLVQG